ncbi:hypothetical protein BDP27DRAFT_1429554 [Rhodocollybia butyracea]|uniref:Uncharacterized protein n=1 Tax=Rhodocollybia butyracea TaxID=206335 RepID=A0A9P5PCK1_9AGAR|nr:hypothetical protein BDP27DRAFT_1429554 [Rhodocollybia butyracea]
MANFQCANCKVDCKSAGGLSKHVTLPSRTVGKDITEEEWEDVNEFIADPVPEYSSPPKPPVPEKIVLKPLRTGRLRYLPATLRDNLPSLSQAMPTTFQVEQNDEDKEAVIPVASPAMSTSPSSLPDPQAPPVTYVSTKPDEYGIQRDCGSGPGHQPSPTRWKKLKRQ